MARILAGSCVTVRGEDAEAAPEAACMVPVCAAAAEEAAMVGREHLPDESATHPPGVKYTPLHGEPVGVKVLRESGSKGIAEPEASLIVTAIEGVKLLVC